MWLETVSDNRAGKCTQAIANDQYLMDLYQAAMARPDNGICACSVEIKVVGLTERKIARVGMLLSEKKFLMERGRNLQEACREYAERVFYSWERGMRCGYMKEMSQESCGKYPWFGLH